MDKKIFLTEFSNSGGCAAKLDPNVLTNLLSKLNPYKDENLFVGIENFGDCGMYKISDEQVILQTLDFFPPMVDNPYDFGQIAAANSLSDVYACGGTPLTALNILAFPANLMDTSIIDGILVGATDKLNEAQTVLLGGHSINDKSLLLGFSITGISKLSEVITNAKSKIGDSLILTKPLGTGLINTAIKQKIDLDNITVSKALINMKLLNDKASQLMKKYSANASTDVTGFGIVGHSYEMATASNITIKLFQKELPKLYSEVINVKCSGTVRNLNHFSKFVKTSATPLLNEILYDPQTSGGLLISISKKFSNDLLSELHDNGYEYASVVGEVIPKENTSIIIE